LASINRQSGVEAAERMLEVIKEMKSPYVVGIELSGDPRTGKFEDYRELIEKARHDLGLKVSLHCAEIEEQAQEADAMIDMKPDRLGHCCFLNN